MTINDLAKIFYSNFHPSIDWGQLEEILWMINEEILGVNKISLASENRFHNHIEQIENQRYKKVVESGDGIRHQALKLIGADFLIGNFSIKNEDILEDILYEYPFLGFEVDVIDRTLHYPLECGDTNAIKLEHYLSQDYVKNMIVIPYPHLSEVSGFIFTALPKFKDYIEFKRKFLRDKLKRR